MAATAAACIFPRIQFQWGREYHRFSLTLIRSCECPLAHPCDRVGLFSILLPKCKPNQNRSLLEIFCDCPVPRNKNSPSCDLKSPTWSRSAALSSLLSAHSSPLFWALLLWLSSAFGIQCLTPASRVFTSCSVYLGVLAFLPLCWFQRIPQASAETLSSRGVSEYAINKFFLNWRRVDLQSCVSFRCTAKWTSDTCIHSFRFFSRLGHSSVPSRPPWATQ